MFTQKLQELYTDGRHFVLEELWNQDFHDFPPPRRFLYSLLRIVMIVARGFLRDRCSLHASALTYITIVSLVPVLAIVFSFSQGLGAQKRLMDVLGVEQVEMVTGEGEEAQTVTELRPSRSGMMADWPEAMQQVAIRIFTYVSNTNFAALGLIGSITLLFTVVFSMSKLEGTVNYIWGVRTGRNFFRQVSEYLVLLILLPIIFLSVTSINAILSSNAILDYLQEVMPLLAWGIRKISRIISILFIVGGFSFFYYFFPNTKVKLFPAFVAGSLAGLSWLVVQWGYIVLQVGLTKYNAIYGTFASFPFFLAWLYANWSIVLVGVEIGFAVQNHRTIEWEAITDQYSVASRMLLGTLILLETSRNYRDGLGGWRPLAYAREHNIPSRVMQAVLEQLQSAGLLIPVKEQDLDELRFVPGRIPSDITPADLEDAFQMRESQEYARYRKQLSPELVGHLEELYRAYQKQLKNDNFISLLDK